MSETISVNRDVERLRPLAIFHYLIGALFGLVSCIPIIHVVVGVICLVSPETLPDKPSGMPPDVIGWMFIVMGIVMVLFGWSLTVCLIYAGRFLARRKCYFFCATIAALSCFIFPFGTILGIFTMITLLRPGVKQVFEQ